MPASFIDSNVILYQFSHEIEKAERAEALIREGGIISVQVLNEVASVARWKMEMTWPQVRVLTETLGALLKVVPLDQEIHAQGLRLCERYGFSVYDRMIVASAIVASCNRLWSEDMHDGLRVEGQLKISNPFALSR